MSGCVKCGQSCYCRPLKQKNINFELAKNYDEYVNAVINLSMKITMNNFKKEKNNG